MLAIGQSVIGDIGVAHGLEDGSIAKTLMHAGLGATYSAATSGNFASGATGGAVGEILAPVTESPELAKVAAASLALATGGNVRSIETAGAVAASGVVYNFGLHPKPTWEQEEARQKQVEQASELVVDYVAEDPIRALDITTDIISVFTAQPEITAAKKLLASGINKGTKLLGLGNKAAKIEKLNGPVDGMIIEHVGIVPPTSKAVTSNLLPKATTKATQRISESSIGITGPPLRVNNFDQTNKAPYNPRKIEQVLQQAYPKSTITSSTLPKINQKNVKLAESAHPKSGIVYDQKGFPIFDDIAVFDTKVSFDLGKRH